MEYRPHEMLQNLVRQMIATASQQSDDSESVGAYATRHAWVEATRDQLGGDFFHNLMIALAESCDEAFHLSGWSVTTCPAGVSLRPLVNAKPDSGEVCVYVDAKGRINLSVHADGVMDPVLETILPIRAVKIIERIGER
jgi:hypothetical protein